MTAPSLSGDPIELTVEARAHGWRIDHYLTRLFPNYSRALFQRAIAQGGVLVNGDFIKPDGTTWDYEPGRFEIRRHIELLRQAGFSDPKSLAHLEPNIESPTAAENYACLVAVR